MIQTYFYRHATNWRLIHQKWTIRTGEQKWAWLVKLEMLIVDLVTVLEIAILRKVRCNFLVFGCKLGKAQEFTLSSVFVIFQNSVGGVYFFRCLCTVFINFFHRFLIIFTQSDCLTIIRKFGLSFIKCWCNGHHFQLVLIKLKHWRFFKTLLNSKHLWFCDISLLLKFKQVFIHLWCHHNSKA